MSAAQRTEAQYASPLAAVIVTAIPVGNDGSAVRRTARLRPITEQPGRGVDHNDRRPCPARGQNLVVWAKWLSPNSVINGHRPQLSQPIHSPGIMPSWAAMPPGIMPWGRAAAHVQILDRLADALERGRHVWMGVGVRLHRGLPLLGSSRLNYPVVPQVDSYTHPGSPLNVSVERDRD